MIYLCPDCKWPTRERHTCPRCERKARRALIGVSLSLLLGILGAIVLLDGRLVNLPIEGGDVGKWLTFAILWVTFAIICDWTGA